MDSRHTTASAPNSRSLVCPQPKQAHATSCPTHPSPVSHTWPCGRRQSCGSSCRQPGRAPLCAAAPAAAPHPPRPPPAHPRSQPHPRPHPRFCAQLLLPPLRCRCPPQCRCRLPADLGLLLQLLLLLLLLLLLGWGCPPRRSHCQAPCRAVAPGSASPCPALSARGAVVGQPEGSEGLAMG